MGFIEPPLRLCNGLSPPTDDLLLGIGDITYRVHILLKSLDQGGFSSRLNCRGTGALVQVSKC